MIQKRQQHHGLHTIANNFCKVLDFFQDVIDTEEVTELLVSDVEVLDMVHVNVEDFSDRAVVESGELPFVPFSESPGFATVEGCVEVLLENMLQ